MIYIHINLCVLIWLTLQGKCLDVGLLSQWEVNWSAFDTELIANSAPPHLTPSQHGKQYFQKVKNLTENRKHFRNGEFLPIVLSGMVREMCKLKPFFVDRLCSFCLLHWWAFFLPGCKSSFQRCCGEAHHTPVSYLSCRKRCLHSHACTRVTWHIMSVEEQAWAADPVKKLDRGTRESWESFLLSQCFCVSFQGDFLSEILSNHITQSWVGLPSLAV